jgi:hypothetical protein
MAQTLFAAGSVPVQWATTKGSSAQAGARKRLLLGVGRGREACRRRGVRVPALVQDSHSHSHSHGGGGAAAKGEGDAATTAGQSHSHGGVTATATATEGVTHTATAATQRMQRV